MNKNFISFKDCFFEEGYHDFFYGYSKNECPYDEGTDGEFGWLIGWEKARSLENDKFIFFKEGIFAFYNKKLINECPYEDQIQKKEWEDGFNEAKKYSY